MSPVRTNLKTLGKEFVYAELNNIKMGESDFLRSKSFSGIQNKIEIEEKELDDELLGEENCKMPANWKNNSDSNHDEGDSGSSNRIQPILKRP